MWGPAPILDHHNCGETDTSNANLEGPWSPSMCEYCGGITGTHASCDHCGAPNPNHLEINGKPIILMNSPVDKKGFHYWPFS
mgnify:CR=1 FL=1